MIIFYFELRKEKVYTLVIKRSQKEVSGKIIFLPARVAISPCLV